MKRKFSTYWLATGILVVLALWLVTGDVQKLRAEAPEASETARKDIFKVAYRLGTAERILRQIPVQGQIEAWRVVEIGARINGVVENLPVEKGQRVEKGAVLVRLSEEDRPAQVKKAEAEVVLAESQLKAAQALVKRGLAAETDLKAKEASIAQARAELAKLKQALHDTVVRAPFAGVVDSRPVEVGQTVQPGSALTSIVDDHKLKLVGQVPQQVVGSLVVGQNVRARLLDGRQTEGELIFISSQADPETRSFRIEAALENPERLRLAGSTAALDIELGEVLAHGISPALLSLDRRGRLSVEHVDENNQVIQTPVERVRVTPDAVWVTGLPEQVRLITMGRGFVTPGTVVEAVEEASLKSGALPNG